MTAAKRRGTAHETAVVNYLKEQGIDARRVVQMGRLDHGDINVEDTVTIEAKDHAKLDLASFVRQALQEAKNAGLPYGVCVAKRRQANIRESYVVTNLETLSRILLELKEARRGA